MVHCSTTVFDFCAHLEDDWPQLHTCCACLRVVDAAGPAWPRHTGTGMYSMNGNVYRHHVLVYELYTWYLVGS